MWPIIGGLLSGGASLLGSIFSSDTSAENTRANIAAQAAAQKESEQFNAQQAQLNRDFQQQMSSTAYQRASTDMKEAGLNPMMMFGSGSAASTPGGASASVGTPNMALSQKVSPLAGLGEAMQRAVSGAVQVKTMDKMADEMANLEATNSLLRKQVDLTQATTALRERESFTEKQRAEDVAASAALKKTQIPQEGVKAVEAGGVLKLPTDVLEKAGVVKYGAGGVGQVLDALSPAARIMQGFSALKTQSLQRKVIRGNFIDKYGTPVDEYLAH